MIVRVNKTVTLKITTPTSILTFTTTSAAATTKTIILNNKRQIAL